MKKTAPPGPIARSKRSSPFDIWTAPPPPKDKDYQWNVTHVMGRPVSPSLLKQYKIAGWRPVPPSRHPGFSVEHNGVRLMERPMALTVDAREEELKATHKQQVQAFKACAPSDNQGTACVLCDDGWVPIALYRKLEGYADIRDPLLHPLDTIELWKYLRKIMGLENG